MDARKAGFAVKPINLFLVSLCLSLATQTKAEISTGDRDLIEKLSVMRKSLNASADQQKACDTPRTSSCSFESMCSSWAKSAGNAYLYQDQEGRQLPNFQLHMYMDFAEGCAGNPFPTPSSNDPFANPKLLKDKKNRTRVEKEYDRAEDIFIDGKKRILAFLQKQRNAKNAKAIDNMITRLQDVKLARVELKNIENFAAEGCEAPNAFYDSVKNSITLCPQMLNLPEASLFQTLAHELGHSVDSCHMSSAFSQSDLFAPAVKISENAFINTLNCLQSKKSLNVKVPSKKELLQKVTADEKKLQQELKEEMEDDSPPKSSDASNALLGDRRREIEKNYEQMKHCNSFSENGDMQEAFADWLASQALAEKLVTMQDSQKAREYAFLAQGGFLGIDCENIRHVVDNKIEAALQNNPKCLQDLHEFTARQKKSAQGADTHPATANRVNRIYLSVPQVQKALGCKNVSDAQMCL